MGKKNRGGNAFVFLCIKPFCVGVRRNGIFADCGKIYYRKKDSYNCEREMYDEMVEIGDWVHVTDWSRAYSDDVRLLCDTEQIPLMYVKKCQDKRRVFLTKVYSSCKRHTDKAVYRVLCLAPHSVLPITVAFISIDGQDDIYTIDADALEPCGVNTQKDVTVINGQIWRRKHNGEKVIVIHCYYDSALIVTNKGGLWINVEELRERFEYTGNLSHHYQMMMDELSGNGSCGKNASDSSAESMRNTAETEKGG